MEDFYKEIIKKEAFKLWKLSGSPSGRDLEFWIIAENNVRNFSGECKMCNRFFRLFELQDSYADGLLCSDCWPYQGEM